MKIPVKLDQRTYNVHIDESGSLTDQLKMIFPNRKFVLITNSTLNKLFSSTITKWENEIPLKKFIIKDGEQYKNLETWINILDFLLNKRCDRSTVIIAFGGGVVGDIAGFAASTMLRGIDFIQIPTTLLAMVDSSVGGKTGVNHPMGKNLIGAFYQPKLVWITTNILDSLPERDFNSGYAEIYKYGFIGERDMFKFIKENHDSIIARNKTVLREAIKRSVEIKARIVAEDERESGTRALLNFGHTFGHALEKFFGFEKIMHGEGVYWGISCAVNLGRRTGTISPQDYETYNEILEKQKLPILPSAVDISSLYQSMFSDKKVLSGKLRFVLPTKPGKSVIVSDINETDILATLKEVFTCSD